MRTSLERLLEEAIDYAGQFPPAKLDLVPALDEYQRLRKGPEKWIVGRFVCAAHRLEALAAALPATVEDTEVAVVASGVATSRAEWEEILERDARLLNKFIQETPERVDVATYEVRLPDVAGIERYIRDLNGFRDVEVYAEIPVEDDIAEALAAIADSQWLNAKLRTGGLDANAFPDAWKLAGFVLGCLDLDIPFKLTAGLHHPLPTWDEPTQATHHGFLNVFVGAAIAQGNDLSQREFERILLDADPRSWSFEDDGLAWHDQEASLEDIEEMRAVLRAFGSCSVHEPLDGLKAIGLMGHSVV